MSAAASAAAADTAAQVIYDPVANVVITLYARNCGQSTATTLVFCDMSGSMSGSRIQQARALLQRLSASRPGWRTFACAEYASECSIDRLQASGGTLMSRWLSKLRDVMGDTAGDLEIIFICDGENNSHATHGIETEDDCFRAELHRLRDALVAHVSAGRVVSFNCYRIGDDPRAEETWNAFLRELGDSGIPFQFLAVEQVADAISIQDRARDSGGVCRGGGVATYCDIYGANRYSVETPHDAATKLSKGFSLLNTAAPAAIDVDAAVALASEVIRVLWINPDAARAMYTQCRGVFAEMAKSKAEGGKLTTLIDIIVKALAEGDSGKMRRELTLLLYCMLNSRRNRPALELIRPAAVVVIESGDWYGVGRPLPRDLTVVGREPAFDFSGVCDNTPLSNFDDGEATRLPLPLPDDVPEEYLKLLRWCVAMACTGSNAQGTSNEVLRTVLMLAWQRGAPEIWQWVADHAAVTPAAGVLCSEWIADLDAMRPVGAGGSKNVILHTGVAARRCCQNLRAVAAAAKFFGRGDFGPERLENVRTARAAVTALKQRVIDLHCGALVKAEYRRVMICRARDHLRVLADQRAAGDSDGLATLAAFELLVRCGCHDHSAWLSHASSGHLTRATHVDIGGGTSQYVANAPVETASDAARPTLGSRPYSRWLYFESVNGVCRVHNMPLRPLMALAHSTAAEDGNVRGLLEDVYATMFSTEQSAPSHGQVVERALRRALGK